MLRNYFKPKVRKNVPTTAAAAGSMTAGHQLTRTKSHKLTVNLQHLEDYVYHERCSRAKIEAAVKAAKEKQDISRLAEEELADNIANEIEAEIASTRR
eukprot:scaffold13579_cov139-Skeletonema_marinoi.AAC.2